ncbi:MAG: hypothetical protein M1347_03910 [Chloroflexi bacterium]|nr:hypothetical protein [Chloroflexota bacterium]
MTQIVSNPSADREEKIEHAAKMLGASSQAKAVFKLVYTGRKTFKTIDDMRNELKPFNKKTYAAANRLAAENILEKKKDKGRNVYYKIDFYTHNRDRILLLSANKEKLKSYPTKRKTQPSAGRTVIALRTKPQTEQISIDDIDSFNQVRSVGASDIASVKGMVERKINRGISGILKQDEKKDWGGEQNDIFSTHVRLRGKRIASAFALKGRGTKGVLTPGKMGKNGDQILRLFQGTSEVYFIVHNDIVHESIYDLL